MYHILFFLLVVSFLFRFFGLHGFRFNRADFYNKLVCVFVCFSELLSPVYLSVQLIRVDFAVCV
jgi:hypothetical protein